MAGLVHDVVELSIVLVRGGDQAGTERVRSISAGVRQSHFRGSRFQQPLDSFVGKAVVGDDAVFSNTGEEGGIAPDVWQASFVPNLFSASIEAPRTFGATLRYDF